MSEYRFLCPACGQSFQDGTGITNCPICQVPLLEAAPVRKPEAGQVKLGKLELSDLEPGKLPDHVDVDALVREALSEKSSDEEIDVAVERVAMRKFPGAHEALCKLIGFQLDGLQKLKGESREDAARQIAEAQSELVTGPSKLFEMRTITTKTGNLRGLEHFSPDERERIAAQIAKALEDGNVHRKIEFEVQGQPIKTSWIAILAAAGFAAVIAWKVWHAAH